MRKLFPIVLLALPLLACEGPMGPAGPTGPAGPQGPQGPVGPGSITYFFTGQIPNTGVGVADLPAAAGTIDKLPQVSCYLSETKEGPYWSVASDVSDETYCVIRKTTAGHLRVELWTVNEAGEAYIGYYYQIVVRPQNS
jgi:hypothetical protein